MSRRMARPPAPCFSEDAIVGRCRLRHAGLPSLGTPPYSCQMRHVPSLLTMQAPTGASGTHAPPNSGQSPGDAMPAMMLPQMHCRTSVDGAWCHSDATSM